MKKWTIIIQISGESNLLSQSISTFNEIYNSYDSKEYNLIIINDLFKIEDLNNLLPDNYAYLRDSKYSKALIYEVKKGYNLETALPLNFTVPDDLNIANNLQLTLEYIKDRYPAENYGYIYKGHGGASGGDVGSTFNAVTIKIKEDECVNSGGSWEFKEAAIRARVTKELILKEDLEYEIFTLNDSADNAKPTFAILLYQIDDSKEMSYMELSKVLLNVFPSENNKKGLSFITIDGCWGMMLENVYIFKENADYFIGSADETPAVGLGYEYLCKLLNNRPQINPKDLASLFVSVFYAIRYYDYDGVVEAFKKMGVSFTCVETKYFDKVFDSLTVAINLINSQNYYGIAFEAALKCLDYTYSYPTKYGVYNSDIVWYLENVIHYSKTKNNHKLTTHLLATIKELKLYLLKGFLGTNYGERLLGKTGLGGYGMAICLPKLISHYKYSIVKNTAYSFFYNTLGWRELLNGMYSYYKSLDAIAKKRILDELKKAHNGITPKGIFYTLPGIDFTKFTIDNTNILPLLKKEVVYIDSDKDNVIQLVQGNDTFIDDELDNYYSNNAKYVTITKKATKTIGGIII